MATEKAQKKQSLKLYALSTCGWCKKTKALLDSLNAEYSFEDVDLLAADKKKAAMDTIKKWNPDCSFPTLVINNEKCIVGFREAEIKEALR